MAKRILLHITLLFCLTVAAQQPQVRNFSPQEYHGGTQNWCVAQAPAGHIFFGNNKGLMMFDGDQWAMYNVANYSAVRAIYHDRQAHRIYVGASNEFGYFETDDQQSTLHYHSLVHLLPQEHRAFGEVWSVFGYGKGIVFQSKTDLFIYYSERENISVCNNGARQESVALIGDRVIMASRDGVFALHGNTFRPLPGTDAMLDKVVRAIVPYGQLTLFVTSEHGVYAYDGKQTVPFELPITSYLKDNQVFCAAIQDSVLAFGTVRGGLVIYNCRDHQASYANVNTGLRNNTVLAVMFDDDHNLWLGLDNGLGYVLNSSPYSNLLGTNTHIGTGYATAIYDHRLYLGTNQGLFVADIPVENAPIPPEPQLLPGMTGQVWTLDNINGTLFCGTDNGAFVVKGLTTKRINGVAGAWNFMPLSLHPDCVLGSDYQGFIVLRRQGDTYVLSHRIHGLDITSGGFYVDDDGTIWISHWQKGIYHIWLSDDLKAVTRQEYFHKGNCLATDEGNLLCRIDGQIYVSCVDGLYRYDKVVRKLVYDKQHSMIFDTYGSSLRIFQSPTGDLWAYKPDFLGFARRQPDGIFVADKQTYQRACSHLQAAAGDVCYLDSLHALFNGYDGFFILNSGYKDLSQERATYIRSVTGTNHADTLLYQNMTAAGQTTGIRIPHSENSIRITFGQAEFREREAVSYSCLLEGYDKEWSEPQAVTSKEYTQLPRGRYTFRVRAFNRLTGKTSEAAFSIEVLPAWYETWWAYLAYGLLFLLMAGLAACLLRRRAERELVRVRTEKERQLKEQQAQFALEQAEQEKALMRLRAEQLEHQMKDSASKLADSTMNLMRKNDILLNLDAQMGELSEYVQKEGFKTNIAKRINNIRHDIQGNIKEDENWEKFEEHFNLVYDDYMVKLTARFPDLKLSDRKLCAYLRMGLSSKEMASLMNTTPHSIETARYRLRQKLQLGSGENLVEFIQSFDNR